MDIFNLSFIGLLIHTHLSKLHMNLSFLGFFALTFMLQLPCVVYNTYVIFIWHFVHLFAFMPNELGFTRTYVIVVSGGLVPLLTMYVLLGSFRVTL